MPAPFDVLLSLGCRASCLHIALCLGDWSLTPVDLSAFRASGLDIPAGSAPGSAHCEQKQHCLLFFPLDVLHPFANSDS